MKAAAVAALLALPLLFACEREKRDLRLDPPALDALDATAIMPNEISGAPPDVYVAMNRTYEANASQLGQGKKPYEWFNCTGCHANGGGGAGPAFLDGWWRYGPDPVSIFASIRDGRPHGMPSFRDKLTPEQVWQLADYVQTIGMYVPRTGSEPERRDAVAPGREPWTGRRRRCASESLR
jgi:cytochrome c oxidase cbb3-type subunit 3